MELGMTNLGVVSCPILHMHMCIRGSGVLCDIFGTWDRATLEFESSTQIADSITMLAWHKQHIES